jgi:peptidoglycan hydrolase CwlO-like protein
MLTRFNTIKVLTLTLALLLCGGLASQTNAQESNQDQSREERRQQLRSELESIQSEIDQQEQRLQKQRQERRSLERDVSILESEIQKAQLEVRKKDIRLNELTDQIGSKENRIEELTDKSERLKESLAELVRRRARVSDVSLVSMAFSNESLSEFFQDIDNAQSINNSMQNKFAQLRDTRSNVEEQKTNLANRKTEVASVRQSLAAEKQKIERKEAEKEDLLAVARSEERTYQDVLEEKEQRAQQIRNELFALRDTSAIPFGQALEYARNVNDSTGVDPAFLLAILRQESNLGKNVGTCNRPQDPESKSWRNIMKPSRDIQPYKRITNRLGLDPDTQPLSCPYGNGWGGAMGPAQFIPSTWSLYEDRIASAVGVETPNPWEPQHAFMASGIYLSDLGADAGTYNAKRRAALKYYSGSNWRSPSVQFYGDQVMQKAQDIQQNMIDPIVEAET